MDREAWQRIKRVAAAAWDTAPAQRSAVVAALCDGDDALQRDVETLLRSATEATDLYEVPAVTLNGGAAAVAAAVSLRPSLIGSRIGAYRIIGELGHGGMGSVYLGQRADGEFEQQVAIKLVGGFPNEPLLERFRVERRILASLHHPHIATLLDGGTTPDGFPFLIMEYVEGTPIDAYCDRRGLDVSGRIELFQRVCDAVHHAHEHQIIHRDIKASNILVTATGVPKLLDFGIAKILESTAEPTNSRTALRALTPESASPEQMRGGPVAPSSDIYALGVLLYRLLTSQSPYGEPQSEQELLRAICEQTPKPPSAARRPVRADTISRELDLIVLKALHKEPERRYGTAAEFAADLRRFLTGHPILAAPDSLRYRTRKFVRRHTVVLAVGVTALLAGMVGQTLLVRERSITSPLSPRSVAVLPFKPLAGTQSDDSYLGVALADAMIGELGAIRSDIHAINAATYGNDDAAVIGRKLGVELVLDGAIQRTGGRLFVTAHLVRAADGVTIWSGRFDQAWSDVFTVQDAIAHQVTRSLAITLSDEDRRRLLRRRTENFDAYESYLRGRYFWNLRTTAGLQKALTYFEQAIDRDPRYAPAYAGLADTYALLGSTPAAIIPPQEAAAQAKRAALKALELDETLAEAEVSLAFTLYSFDWDWVAGERHFRRAIDLDPDYVAARYWYALYLGQSGRFDEQLRESQHALELEPLSLVGTYSVALAHYNARRFDLAREYTEKALEISPDFPLAGRLLAKIDSAEARYADQVAHSRQQYDGAPDNSMSAALMAHAYGRAGETAKARKIMDDLIAQSATSYVSPANIAIGFIGLDQPDEALRWLEKAYVERSQGLTFLKTDPLFDPLRDNPRFDALLKGIGLVP